MPGVTATAKADHSTATTTPATGAAAPVADPPLSEERTYSPGLEGVIAGESSIAFVDGAAGRLLYRGYPIGELVEHGTYAQVAELLWTGAWPSHAHLPCAHLPSDVAAVLRLIPPSTHPMDALRTGVSAWGAGRGMNWPPTLEQARALTSIAPSILAAFARFRQGLEHVEADPQLDLAAGFLYQLRGERPDPAAARALDAYFVVGAEHGFNASTFTALVITSTKSDLASGVCGAIGALKGPLHGGAPSEVVDQLSQIGTPEHAEAWLRDAIARGERLMGFGHRVYKAYDPRAAALRKVAEGLSGMADWLALAVEVEDVALRVLAELKPDHILKTNVEYYAAAVLQGVGLPPDLFPATFALARHAGWTAHCIEYAATSRLIRPDVLYTGPEERHLPAIAPVARRKARSPKAPGPTAKPKPAATAKPKTRRPKAD
jgi:citrate synthase